MSTGVTVSGTSLSEQVADEIRAWMGRRRMTQAQLARRLGVSPMWVSYRLNGVQPIDLNDLQKIAQVLDVPVNDLLPSSNGRSRPTPTERRREPRRSVKTRPNGGPRNGSTRPASPERPTQRRPVPLRNPIAA